MISHNHHLYEELTAEENLRFAATMRGIRPDRGQIRKALADVGLATQAAWKVRTYSTGMKRRLVIGKMLLFDPELLFLDEPHNTLDQAAIALLNGYVASVKARGGSAIVATHNLSRAYDMADRFLLMREGAVTKRADKDRLTVDQLRELYTRYAENDEREPSA
jgi:ABC-type multidrug transport system ATPase subunit